MGLVMEWTDSDLLLIITWADRNKKTTNGRFVTNAFRARERPKQLLEAITELRHLESQGCVAAAYELGRACEFSGRSAEACSAYERAASAGHIGGHVGLHCLVKTSGADPSETLRMTTAAAARPDAMALAQHVGAVSCIADAAWFAAEFMRFDGRSPALVFEHRATGGRPRAVSEADKALADKIERVLLLGERVGDDFCAFGRIEERVGLLEGTLKIRGLPEHVCYDHSSSLKKDEAMAMCARLAGTSMQSEVRSKAATVAADIASVDKFSWYRRAADEQSPTGASVLAMWMALDSGVGLPRDCAAARQCVTGCHSLSYITSLPDTCILGPSHITLQLPCKGRCPERRTLR